MTLQSLILLALKASIPLSVFAIGLGSRFDDALYLLRRPALLVPSVLAMNVVMPLVAATMAWAFDLPGAVEISLVALAVSPIPPLLPKKQIKAHGEPHRKHLRHRAAQDDSVEGMPLEPDRARHGVQAGQNVYGRRLDGHTRLSYCQRSIKGMEFKDECKVIAKPDDA